MRTGGSSRAAGVGRLARGAAGGVASLAAVASFVAPAARAGQADVIAARATCNAERICLFAVTIKHADTGWKHYADRFEVLAPDGTVLGTRILQHPHVHEQPFTRSLVGVEVPPGVDRVTVRAHDLVHGLGGETVDVVLAFPSAVPPDEASPPTRP